MIEFGRTDRGSRYPALAQAAAAETCQVHLITLGRESGCCSPPGNELVMTQRSHRWSGGHRGPGHGPAGGRDLRFKDLYRASKEFELMERAMGFAALAILTVIPLLIVVAAANSASSGAGSTTPGCRPGGQPPGPRG